MSVRFKYFPVVRYETNPEIDGRKITAVYFLIKNGVIVYIGQTRNLKSRICTHKSSLFRKDWFDSFRFIECSNTDLNKYEKRWINRFDPQYNGGMIMKFKAKNAKESVGLLLSQTRAKNLRQFAVKEQKTISTIVENALDSYGITA